MARAGVPVDADFVEAAGERGGNYVEFRVDGGEFGVGADDFAPDFAVEMVEGFGGRAFDEKLAVADDGHARAEFADVFDDVGGENDDDVAADGAEEIEEAIAFGGVEAGGGLVHDDELGIGEE